MKAYLIALLLPLMVACDHLAPAERWGTPRSLDIEQPDSTTQDTPQQPDTLKPDPLPQEPNPTPEEPQPAPEEPEVVPLPLETRRTVLVEEFTAQRCRYCPEGAALIAEWDARYGKRVVAVAMHTSGLAFFVDNQPYGLALRWSSAIAGKAGVQFLPSASFDRQRAQVRESWESELAQRLLLPTPLALQLHVDVVKKGEIPFVRAELLAAELRSASELDGARLHVYLTEDGLVAPQIMMDGSWDREYVHHHVLRARLTPAEGLPLGTAVELSDFAQSPLLAYAKSGKHRLWHQRVDWAYRAHPLAPDPTSPVASPAPTLPEINDELRISLDRLTVVAFVTDAQGQVVQATQQTIVAAH